MKSRISVGFITGMIAAVTFAKIPSVSAEPTIVAAEPTTRPEGCPGSPEIWSETEVLVWRELCEGNVADLAVLRPDDAYKRVLRSTFLADLAVRERLTPSFVPSTGIEIKNAIFDKGINLAAYNVRQRIVLTNCLAFFVDLSETRLQNLFAFRDCRVQGDIAAPGIDAKGGLDLSGTSVGGNLNLQGAQITDAFDLRKVIVEGNAANLRAIRVEGEADLGGFRTAGDLNLQDARIEGPLRLDRRAEIGTLRMTRARIDGSVILSGATIHSIAKIDAVQIQGDLLIRKPKNGPAPQIGAALVLNQTHVGGRIELAHLRVGSGISMDAVTVGEDIWLRDCSEVSGAIKLQYAEIGQNLDLSSSRLHDVDATGAIIKGELRLGALGTQHSAPVWVKGAMFRLRNVRASSWVDAYDPSSEDEPKCPKMPIDADPWPTNLDLIGFNYEALGGLRGKTDIAGRPASWFNSWLARQEPFSFQPYRHLASVLTKIGNTATAKRVLFQGRWEEAWSGTAAFSSVFLILQGLFVGFGYYPGIALVWAVVLIFVGQQVFRRTSEARAYKMPYGLAYSADMLLPFVTLREIHKRIELHGPARYYFYFHKIMGWALAFFIAAAVTGILQK